MLDAEIAVDLCNCTTLPVRTRSSIETSLDEDEGGQTRQQQRDVVSGYSAFYSLLHSHGRAVKKCYEEVWEAGAGGQ